MMPVEDDDRIHQVVLIALCFIDIPNQEFRTAAIAFDVGDFVASIHRVETGIVPVIR